MGYVFFFPAEDGIRGWVTSRGVGDVYKGQVGESHSWDRFGFLLMVLFSPLASTTLPPPPPVELSFHTERWIGESHSWHRLGCLLMV